LDSKIGWNEGIPKLFRLNLDKQAKLAESRGNYKPVLKIRANASKPFCLFV